MFTGLIETTGQLVVRTSRSEGARVRIACRGWSSSLVRGESVSVEGVCLTVTECEEDQFVCDLLLETCERTTLGQIAPGRRLNLERALTPSSRIGGHFVTGHVDGVGVLIALRWAGADRVMEIQPPPELMAEIVPKGSIAVNGVSLTVARLFDDRFEVHLIPHTWENTSFPELAVGDLLNLETDLLAKYVRRMAIRKGELGITWERLGDAGFI